MSGLEKTLVRLAGNNATRLRIRQHVEHTNFEIITDADADLQKFHGYEIGRVDGGCSAVQVERLDVGVFPATRQPNEAVNHCLLLRS